MKIVICVKPIKTEYVATNGLTGEAYVINPYDIPPILDALALKKKFSCEVITLSMSVPSSEQALVKLKAVGVDRVILLTDSKFSGADTIATSKVLYHAIKKLEDVDVIAFGNHAVDGETGQVGIGVSELMNRECILGIKSIQSFENNIVLMGREKDGMYQKIAVSEPFVAIYSDFSLQQLDYSLIQLKRAKAKGIEIWNCQLIGIEEENCGILGSKTKVSHIERELISKENQIIEGTVAEQVDRLFQLIQR